MVKSGYLSVITHQEHPGFVLLRATQEPLGDSQQLEDPAETAWLCMHFADIEAARMHAHTALRRQFQHDDLYQTDLVNAIVAVEAITLKNEIVYTNPEIPEQKTEEISALKQHQIARKKKLFAIGNFVGKLALIFLALQMLSPLITQIFFSSPQ